MLECADNTLYTGWTDDLSKRLQTHNTGKASKYTRARLPVRLVYCEQLADKSAALKREAAIKKLTRAQKNLLISQNTKKS